MSLYILSRYFRQFIIGFLVFAILVIMYTIISGMFQETLDPFNPNISPWANNPQNSFGDDIKLPELSSLAISSSVAPEFNLIGQLPLIPDTALVYEIDRPREKFNSLDQAKIVSGIMGFNPEAVQVSPNDDSLLIWENDLRTRRLEHHILNRSWNLQTVSYFQDPNAVQIKTTDPENDYAGDISAIFSRLGINTNDFNRSKIEYIFTKRLADRFRPINFNETPEYVIGTIYRQLQASYTRAGFTAEDADGNQVDEYFSYVYSDDPFTGSVHVVTADAARDPALELYELRYTDFEFSNVSSFYSVISPGLAWQNIQVGKGYLKSLIPQGSSRYDDPQVLPITRFTADAARTELAYYEPPEWTGYIYPIYIFRGTAEIQTGGIADFVFYVDALNP